MPLTLPCPSCNDPQTVPDEAVGHTVRCQTCQAEFRASAAAPVAPPWEPKRRTRVLPWMFGLLVLVGVGAVVWYFVFWTGTPTDYTDPDGVYSARFPDEAETSVVSVANPGIFLWGERQTKCATGGREYAVSALDGLLGGDKEVGPANRDGLTENILVVTLVNANASQLIRRPTEVDGHKAQEAVFVGKDDGRLLAIRVVVGERTALRITVSGSGDREKAEAFLDRAAEFFDTVRPGPAFGAPIVADPSAVMAAELVAAYQADPKAADAKYRDRWLRVTGPVSRPLAGGNEFELGGHDGVVVIRPTDRGRSANPPRRAGLPAVATGKCLGLVDPTAGGPVRVVLESASILRPPGNEPKE